MQIPALSLFCALALQSNEVQKESRAFLEQELDAQSWSSDARSSEATMVWRNSSVRESALRSSAQTSQARGADGRLRELAEQLESADRRERRAALLELKNLGQP